MKSKDKSVLIAQARSFELAVSIINLCKSLRSANTEGVLINQIIKSGTTIGANVEEAKIAQNDNEFFSKLSNALNEINKTKYWLKLLYKTNCIDEKKYTTLNDECDETYKLISNIVSNQKDKAL